MNIRLWLTYAARNLRSGLKGFYILLTCLTLGVAAIAVIGSLTSAIEQGLTEQGQPLLGGDVEFSLIHREATAPELAYIKSKGTTSRVATLRAMATANAQSTLVEIKAIDAAYPLFGQMSLKQLGNISTATAIDAGVHGVVVDELLLGRLALKVGDTLKIGTNALKVTGVIAAEPDRISDGIVLGPRLMMTHEALQSTGLIQPGSLITWRYRVKLNEGSNLKARQINLNRSRETIPRRRLAGASDRQCGRRCGTICRALRIFHDACGFGRSRCWRRGHGKCGFSFRHPPHQCHCHTEMLGAVVA